MPNCSIWAKIDMLGKNKSLEFHQLDKIKKELNTPKNAAN